MNEKSTFPAGIDLGLAGEINFVIGKFCALPTERGRELARALLDNPTDSKEFAEVGEEIFALIYAGDGDEFTEYMVGVLCDGERLFDMYFVAPMDFAPKARRCALYFRDSLVYGGDGCDVPKLTTPQRAPA